MKLEHGNTIDYQLTTIYKHDDGNDFVCLIAVLFFSLLPSAFKYEVIGKVDEVVLSIYRSFGNSATMYPIRQILPFDLSLYTHTFHCYKTNYIRIPRMLESLIQIHKYYFNRSREFVNIFCNDQKGLNFMQLSDGHNKASKKE